MRARYVISPKDVVVARARDVDDKISWALDREDYEEVHSYQEHFISLT